MKQGILPMENTLDDWAHFIARKQDPYLSAERLEANMGIDARKLIARARFLGLVK